MTFFKLFLKIIKTMYIDPIYILFLLPTLIISLFSTILMKYWTNKYFNVPASTNLTGRDALYKIAQQYELNVKPTLTMQNLGDHYNPISNTVALSPRVANYPTIASIAITAHELGHALQHKNNMLLISLRKVLLPIVNIGTYLGYTLMMLGFLLSFFNLARIGLLLFSLSTLFTFLTLPIELDASKKGLNMIKSLKLLNTQELNGAKKVLFAAALTYVAALVSSLSNLAYFFLQVKGLEDREQ